MTVPRGTREHEPHRGHSEGMTVANAALAAAAVFRMPEAPLAEMLIRDLATALDDANARIEVLAAGWDMLHFGCNNPDHGAAYSHMAEAVLSRPSPLRSRRRRAPRAALRLHERQRDALADANARIAAVAKWRHDWLEPPESESYPHRPRVHVRRLDEILSAPATDAHPEPPAKSDRDQLAYLITSKRFHERGIQLAITDEDVAVAIPMAEFLLGEGLSFRDSEPPTEATREPSGTVADALANLIDKALDGDCGYGVGAYLSDQIRSAFRVTPKVGGE